MLVYAACISERLRYLLDELFAGRMGISWQHTDSLEYFERSQAPKLNYATRIVEGCVNIPAAGLLFEEDLFVQQINVEQHSHWRYIFFKRSFENIPDFRHTTAYLPFDLFAAAFYLMSRYEEYLPSVKDEHKRYKETNSLAYQNGFLELPLIDIWMMRLQFILQKQYPSLVFKPKAFQQINSIDIDFAYKYKGLPVSRLARKAVGSMVRGTWDKQVLSPPQHDPYDTYDYLTAVAAEKNIDTLFFFLLGSYGGNDMAHPPQSAVFTALLQKLSSRFQCGIHPSYRSSVNNKVLEAELQLFQNITGKKALISRNHFLKVKFPDSYMQLQSHEIRCDYSLGYPNHTGFRASTSLPFRFFNLVNNTAYPLLVQPVCIMDVTLKNAMKLDADAAILKIKAIRKQVAETNGNFMSIWHNSSFDEAGGWDGWQRVYKALFET